MELKSLLSVVIAALTALGAMLYAMGSQSPWLAMSLWLAAVVSLVVTDFLGAVRLPRNLASLLMWGVLAIFLPYFLCVQSDWDSSLQSVVGILFCLQITLLFQEKDPRVYGWLAVMSLLQVVVAARYSQGVAFGGLLIAYTLVGMLAMSLLVLYSQWGHHRGPRDRGWQRALTSPRDRHSKMPVPRWRRAPLAAGRRAAELQQRAGGQRAIGSGLRVVCPAGADRRRRLVPGGGHVPDGAPPRAFRLACRLEKIISTVGFNDQIELGKLGETIENPRKS